MLHRLLAGVLVLFAGTMSLAARISGPLPQTQPAQLSGGPAGAGLIIGRVVDGLTDSPLASAVVTISGPSAPTTGNAVVVDSRGRFVFRGLAAGRYSLTAQRTGYMSGAYGRLRFDGAGQPLDLSDGARMTNVEIRVWPYASISGTVIDETGEPLVGVYIYPFERNYLAGRPSLTTRGATRTDDRGMYRLGQLRPGDYVVAMVSRLVTYPISVVAESAAAREAGEAARDYNAELAAKGANRMGVFPTYPSMRIGDFVIASADSPLASMSLTSRKVFPTTYYPSVTSPESATIVSVGAGQQRSSVDLQVKLTSAVNISGTAKGPDGSIANLALRLQLGGANDLRYPTNIEPAQTVTGPNGAFTFVGVPSGKYIISATMSPGTSGAELYASEPVTVGDADVADVSVTLRPDALVTGRVEYDGTSPRPTAAQLRALPLYFDQATGRGLRLTTQVTPDGTVAPTSVPPGKYFVHLAYGAGIPSPVPPVSWTVKSVTAGGRDVSDSPLIVEAGDVALVVTLTDHALTLGGTVRNAQGAPDVTASVLLFPADRAQWTDYGAYPRRLQMARADRMGTFSLSNLPAGDYLVIALPDGLVAQWQTQTFLERAAQLATHVSLTSDRNVTVDLRTSRW
jgi:hypothetical protein